MKKEILVSRFISWVVSKIASPWSVFLINTFILVYVFYWRFSGSTLENTVFIQLDNMVSFAIFLAGFTITLLLITKDLAFLDKSKLSETTKTLFLYVVFFSILAFVVGLTTIGLVPDYPTDQTFDSPLDVIAYIENQTGIRYDLKSDSVTFPENREIEESREIITYAIKKLLNSLSVSHKKLSREFYLAVNTCISFFLMAIINLVFAAISNLYGRNLDE